jgi:hypothetical protein
MTIINEQFLTSLGVKLSSEETALLSEHFETTLQRRIFDEIIEELDQPQAEMLSEMADRNDPTITEWLNSNVPELSAIVQDEVDILLGELVANKDSLGHKSDNPVV